MSKSKLLTTAVIALILINIATLFFFFTNGPKGPRGRDRISPKEIVIQKLHFDEQQIIAYDHLIEKHSETIQTFDEKIKMGKKELFNQLSKPENKVITDSLTNEISKMILEIEKTHYNHFLDIKKLCKPKQLDDFESLTLELSQIFAPMKPKPID